MKALTERHVQAIWYDAQLRPSRLVTRRGSEVRVVSPGEWNLGPGPDFRHAVLEIGPERRRLVGDVEVHVCPSDYDFHRHGADPAYRNVVAHVTWSGGPDPRTLPEGAVSIWIGRLVTANASFALDQVDLMAYPYARLPLASRPCEDVFRDSDRAQRLLAAAGRHRLKMKARRLAGRMVESMRRLQGPNGGPMTEAHDAAMADAVRDRARRQLFYEEIMTALGYSRNSLQFRRVAERAPIAELSTDVEFARAVLKSAGEFEIWDCAAVRPRNSPMHRLLMAAEILVDTPIMSMMQASGFSSEDCRRMVDSVAHGHLMGKGRAAAILANVIVPWAIADERLETAPDWLPPEDISEPVRLTAYRLFGRDHNPRAHYAGNGLLIQGLLQIHRDYCLQMHPDCRECALGNAPVAVR